MTAISRAYPLRVVLAVTTGVPGLASAHEMQALLSHMVGSTVWAHQIPRAADVCQKYLRDQYSWLVDMRPTDGQAADERKLAAWLANCERRYARSVAVMALPGDAYTVMDPIVEFTERMSANQGAGLVGSDG